MMGLLRRSCLLSSPIAPGDEQEFRHAVTLDVEKFLTGTV